MAECVDKCDIGRTTRRTECEIYSIDRLDVCLYEAEEARTRCVMDCYHEDWYDA